VVEQVVTEITALGLTRVLLWGHSTGTAFAVATARRLHERGVDVQRVFLGAYLPGDASTREAAVGELSSRANTEIAAMLASDSGYTELGELDAERAEHVGAAYRHDCLSVHHYLADAMEQPPATKLAAPVTVVVAGDDPKTAGAAGRYRTWQLLAEQVELHELADGGHYFPRTRPAEAARAVLHGLASLTSA
jgi:surfactin synthase thioesterase subunit